MSAMIALHREIVSRRNLTALQAIMQSQRASVLEKQEAELALSRIRHANLQGVSTTALLECELAWAREAALQEHNNQLRDLVLSAMVEEQRVNNILKEVVDNYWAIIDACTAVGWETKENARGHKRKPPAAEQLKKIEEIVCEHNRKRARMVVDAMGRAGSSTDRR